MTATLTRFDSTILAPSQHPALVYLAHLGQGSRRTMSQALDVIASLVSGGVLDAGSMDWAALRYEHTTAIRSALAERYAPTAATKMLCALRAGC